MRTPSKWQPLAETDDPPRGPRLDHAIAVDAETHGKLLRLAYRAGGEDVRERMAEQVRRRVEWLERWDAITRIVNAEERSRAFAALAIEDLSDRALEWVIRLAKKQLREAYADVLHRPEMTELRALLMDVEWEAPDLADGTAPGTEKLHGDRCMCAGAWCRERPAR